MAGERREWETAEEPEPDPTEAQLVLPVGQRPQPWTEWVSLEDLPADDAPEMVSDPPLNELVQSVFDNGVWVPILLRETADGRQEVAAGRRRIKACREARRRWGKAAEHLKQVPARVFPAGYALAEVLTIGENQLRRENPASDFRAIKGLLARGKGLDYIRAQAGLSPATLRKRMRFFNLLPELQDGFLSGRFRSGVALAAARLSPERQRNLLPILEATGTLTQEDVRAALQIQVQAGVSLLPAEMFETPDADVDLQPVAPVSWREEAGELIRRALLRVPAEEAGVQFHLRQARAMLAGEESGE